MPPAGPRTSDSSSSSQHIKPPPLEVEHVIDIDFDFDDMAEEKGVQKAFPDINGEALKGFLNVLQAQQRIYEDCVKQQDQVITYVHHMLQLDLGSESLRCRNGLEVTAVEGAEDPKTKPQSSANLRVPLSFTPTVLADGAFTGTDSNSAGRGSNGLSPYEYSFRGSGHRSMEDSNQVSKMNSTATGERESGTIQALRTGELLEDEPRPPEPKLGGFDWSKPIRRVLITREFELVCTAFMLANVLGMIIRLELDGMLAGELLGVYHHTGVSQDTLRFMEDVEVFFTLWFALELLLRYWGFGFRIFCEVMGMFDAVIVLVTVTDLFMTQVFDFENMMNLSIARIIRILKVMKFLRAFKAASSFTELRILLRTVMRSTMALIWALIILTLIILTCSSLMVQLLHETIVDSTVRHDLRMWTFEHYGTASRAAWTILEATLSGGWPNYARILVMDIHPIWALFWFFYVFIVIFAVIRVMGALFLTASLKAAEQDDELQAIRRIKDVKRNSKQLNDIFLFVPGCPSNAGDDSDPEAMTPTSTQRHKAHFKKKWLTRAELNAVLSSWKKCQKLTNIGYEPVELRVLFDIIADGEDKVRWAAFLKSCMRLKNGVKAIDVIEILHEVDYCQNMIRMDSQVSMQHAVTGLQSDFSTSKRASPTL
mmetsp:Transcript_8770/g.19598  ORF Transcript_8770/g.19598 Transcript_8770/m.19598 type:complete len:654 (+) Transcript_8770:88-2049(+)|eukprot:CAMPEP_0178383102 /NCGR_PEP_ID=MMETSP0689_2-20121128/6830_1 /TAXON_ID=160604 /ORGANISM="Amphidinium massartii, Strain CS-259" /LENGTH=653 /DNA_ID=CAMNT_0020003315 /DNA_START=80 /DNA_END=2041 /DNA_ORIENTATION=+